MNVSPSNLIILSAVSGSVIIEGAADIFEVDEFATFVVNGNSQMPIESFEKDGVTVVPPGAPFPWYVIGIVIGLLLLVVLIVVLVIYLKKRKRNQKYDSYVTDTESRNTIAAYTPLQPIDPVAAKFLTLRVSSDVIDTGEGVLSGVKAGDIAQVTKEDYGESGDWIWAKVEGRGEGWIPRGYCVPM
jgi:hypothetical protein